MAAVGWVGGMVGGAVLGGIWIGTTGQDETALATLAAFQIGFWAGLVAAVVVTSRRGGTGSVAHDFGVRSRARDAPVGIVTGLAAQFVLIPALYLPVRSLVDKGDLEQPAKELAEKADGLSYLAFAAAIALIAPVVEELFFRGLLLRSLQNYLGETPAIVVSGLIFGVSHFQPLLIPGLSAVGILFAVLTVRTGRLGPAIWAHAAFNGITVILLA
jgi:membrane protease YdiL (CAAX protease family)